MPIIKSTIKRAKQNATRRERLRPYRTHMKTIIKKMAEFSKEGRKDEAKKLLREVYKAIDIAAKKKIIHKKNAARKKARVSRLAVG